MKGGIVEALTEIKQRRVVAATIMLVGLLIANIAFQIQRVQKYKIRAWDIAISIEIIGLGQVQVNHHPL